MREIGDLYTPRLRLGPRRMRRYLVLAATVPDYRAPRLAKLYLATATLATAWVGVASWFLLVWTLKVRNEAVHHAARLWHSAT